MPVHHSYTLPSFHTIFWKGHSFPAELNQLSHGYHRVVPMLLTHLHLETPQILSRLCNCCCLCPRRFAEEYKKEPNRGYGMAVVNVFKKLLSPKCSDVFEPARAQFNGKGSYGNGGAMRVAGIPLTYWDVQDVKKVLCSLGRPGSVTACCWLGPALLSLGFANDTFSFTVCKAQC